MELASDIKAHIRLSQPSDNEGLLRLTSLAGMQGNISFRTDRFPNFFRLAAVRGQSVTVVAELQDEIVGAASFSQVPVFLGGKESTAFYIADFKVHPDHRKKGITLMLIQLLLEKLHEKQADVVFSTSIAGNKAIEKFYAGNDQWPAAAFAGQFLVYQMLPLRYANCRTSYKLKTAEPDAGNIAFLNNQLQKHELAPVLTPSSLSDSSLLEAYLQDERVAAVCVCDAAYMKQETITGLPPALRLLTKLANPAGNRLSLINLPRMHEEMKILYIRSFACKPGHEKALEQLIRRVLTLARKEHYHFVTVGVHERDPLKKIFSKHWHFTVHSNLYTGSLKNNQDSIRAVLEGIPFFDYSRV